MTSQSSTASRRPASRLTVTFQDQLFHSYQASGNCYDPTTQRLPDTGSGATDSRHSLIPTSRFRGAPKQRTYAFRPTEFKELTQLKLNSPTVSIGYCWGLSIHWPHNDGVQLRRRNAGAECR